MRNYIFQLSSIALLWAFSACAPTVTRPAPERYALHMTDNVADRRFEIVLKSYDEKTLCVQVDKWPNSAGLLHMGADLATLRTARGLLPAHDDNFGYCPGGCGQHRIGPHGELHGLIAYEAFGDPEELAEDPNKKLEFSVMPFYCRDR